MATERWTTYFSPQERHEIPDIEAVVESVDWLLHGIAGLAAICLFILAANRSRQGDVLGSCLSSLGAIVSAIAPILAKHFQF